MCFNANQWPLWSSLLSCHLRAELWYIPARGTVTQYSSFYPLNRVSHSGLHCLLSSTSFQARFCALDLSLLRIAMIHSGKEKVAFFKCTSFHAFILNSGSSNKTLGIQNRNPFEVSDYCRTGIKSRKLWLSLWKQIANFIAKHNFELFPSVNARKGNMPSWAAHLKSLLPLDIESVRGPRTDLRE